MGIIKLTNLQSGWEDPAGHRESYNLSSSKVIVIGTRIRPCQSLEAGRSSSVQSSRGM